MKATTTLIRIFLGLVFLVASVGFFMKFFPEPIENGNFKAFQCGTFAASFLIPFAKAVELLCAVSFLCNKYVSLANILILPVTVNIILINYFLNPENLPLAILVFLGNLFLIYRHWNNYKTVFTP